MEILLVRQEEKLWGRNHIIHIDHSFQICHIFINKGGFCSNHLHTHKWNQFYIVSGKLTVMSYDSEGMPTGLVVLGPTECIKIPPGMNHRFEALEDTQALEIYWSELSEHDIVRTDLGGVRA